MLYCVFIYYRFAKYEKNDAIMELAEVKYEAQDLYHEAVVTVKHESHSEWFPSKNGAASEDDVTSNDDDTSDDSVTVKQENEDEEMLESPFMDVQQDVTSWGEVDRKEFHSSSGLNDRHRYVKTSVTSD